MRESLHASRKIPYKPQYSHQDIVSLVIQAAGGGIASSANTNSAQNLVRIAYCTSAVLKVLRILGKL